MLRWARLLLQVFQPVPPLPLGQVDSVGFSPLEKVNSLDAHTDSRKSASENRKMLPKKVVIPPQDSVTVPQLGGTAHQSTVHTGPEGAEGQGQGSRAENETQRGTQRDNWGNFLRRCIPSHKRICCRKAQSNNDDRGLPASLGE